MDIEMTLSTESEKEFFILEETESKKTLKSSQHNLIHVSWLFNLDIILMDGADLWSNSLIWKTQFVWKKNQGNW